MVVNLPVPKTRLAPSPTGALHLGNARTFLINWLLARKLGWHIVMRIEDLDGPRLKQGAAEQAIDDLQWLGLDWDEPSPPATYTQRADLTPYLDALTHLQHLQLLYPCSCTRTQIENALSAPHADDHELRYPGTCRPANSPALSDSTITMHHQSQVPSGLLTLGHDRLTALRLIIPDEPLTFTDQIHGPITCNVQQQVGDFVVLTKLGFPAYQLAVVVDDARQGITHIVRGDDLLSSTARQLLLYQFLRLTPIPNYWHLPLVLGHDGKRLAKRHGDSRLAHYRSLGVPPQKILGLLACWTGLLSQPVPIDLPTLLSIFDIRKLPRTPAIFTPEHHQWLITK